MDRNIFTDRNKHNESVGSKVERSDERIIETGEVFTPTQLCNQMVSEIPESVLKDNKSKFLDNSAGSGNFMVALRDELVKYHSLNHVLDNMLYAVELMEDNHKEMCERLGVTVDHKHYCDIAKKRVGNAKFVGDDEGIFSLKGS